MSQPSSQNRRHRRQKSRKSNTPFSAAVEVTVDAVGMRGDGLARTETELLYISNTAPGDRVSARPGPKRGDGRVAQLVEILAPGQDRVDPACRHAEICGGCVLQHLAPNAIADIKRGHLISALARRGFSGDLVTETRSIPAGTRRRLRLSLLRSGGKPVLGFNRRSSSELVDIAECPVSRPELAALLPEIRKLAGSLNSLGKGGDIQLALTDTGIDMLIIPIRDNDPDLGDRQRMVAFADAHDLARVAWESDGFAEPVATRRPPQSLRHGCTLDLPIGAFQQPSAEGEAILAELVRDALPKAARTVADLYAGCGSLSLPLAVTGINVLAIEGEAAPVDALRRAAAGLRLQAERRDLARNPLTPAELDRFDAVILDPPRAGAAEQADRLADSNVATLVAVSCNPATLARDLRVLVDGGYTLERVTPVDQFTWSSHLEAVAVLRR